MNMQHHKVKVCFRSNECSDIKTSPAMSHINDGSGCVALAGTVRVCLLSYLSDRAEGEGSRGMTHAHENARGVYCG